MHKRESFSQMITFEFLSKRLIKDLNLHFQENEIKTDRLLCKPPQIIIQLKKKGCIDLLFVSGTMC